MMWRTLGRGLLSAIAALLLTALATAPCLGSSREEVVLESRSSQGRSGTLILRLKPLRTMTPVPMYFILSDGMGASIDNAKVGCALTMPAMAMPENHPQMTGLSKGYAGEAVFTMAGTWRATFSLVLPSGEQDTIDFTIDRVFLK